MGKFVSLKDDVSFKFLFLNETVRLHFISDVLGIPFKEIHSMRLANTFLWRRYIYLSKLFMEVLNKPLSGTGRMDEWIRLFNAQTEQFGEMSRGK